MNATEALQPIQPAKLVVKDVSKSFTTRRGWLQALDCVSLTVNAVEGDVFDINLIPHTVSVTTLRHLKPGSPVNLEVDQIARYVERMLSAG